jgi:pimeloyl-ACP methyl ester carboxylesterase
MNARTGQQMPLDLTLLTDYEANRDRLDVTAAAARLTAPWVIVHGTDDVTVRAEEARALARVAHDASLVLVDGAGHTFEARHPFEGSTPELDRALTVTLEHFRHHLAD